MQIDLNQSNVVPLNRIVPGSSIMLLLVLALRAGAQDNQSRFVPSTTPTTTTKKQDRIALPSESLGADDLLELSVSYCPELNKSFRVSSDGTLALPLIHTKLIVTGLTPAQVTKLIETTLIEEHVLAEPIVSVSVIEYRSRPVSVVGAVNRPLTFQATGQTTLLDALAQAGGLSSGAGGTIIVSTARIPKEEIKQSRILKRISVKDLISGGDADLNLILKGGEEIRVPEAAKVFVAGNVRRPGLYPMQGDTDTTVIKAITLSEGLDSYSSANAFIYRRVVGEGEREEVKIPLSRILAHKSPDIALIADDILYIPSSDGKRLTSRFLNQLAGFGQAAGTGLLIYK